MYYNIYLFVVISFKSMMIYNTMNMLHPPKLQRIIFCVVIMYCVISIYVNLLKADEDHF